jgi:anti-sigma regulatory factor (Ser/Thr protein kinase)
MGTEAQPAEPTRETCGLLGFATFPPTPASAPQARRWVHSLLPWLQPGTVYDVDVLVSELVGNAILHTNQAGVIHVDVTHNDDVLRVEVTDNGSGDWGPTAGHEGGRGLAIVEQLSDGWGITHGKDATTVGFEFKTAGRCV